MFKTVKKLHQKPFENPTKYNDKGKVVTSPQEVHKIIQNHFKNQFHKEDLTEIEKHVGEPKPLTQIILLEISRKILSKTLLNRIQPKVNTYLSKCQDAYKIGRSTADIVWA